MIDPVGKYQVIDQEMINRPAVGIIETIVAFKKRIARQLVGPINHATLAFFGQLENKLSRQEL